MTGHDDLGLTGSEGGWQETVVGMEFPMLASQAAQGGGNRKGYINVNFFSMI